MTLLKPSGIHILSHTQHHSALVVSIIVFVAPTLNIMHHSLPVASINAYVTRLYCTFSNNLRILTSEE